MNKKELNLVAYALIAVGAVVTGAAYLIVMRADMELLTGTSQWHHYHDMGVLFVYVGTAIFWGGIILGLYEWVTYRDTLVKIRDMTSDETEVWFCPSCGNLDIRGADYCPKCGKPLLKRG
jgi:hypothetical protein